MSCWTGSSPPGQRSGGAAAILIGTWRDSRLGKGRVVVGILNQSAHQPAVRVSFTDVEMRA